MVDLLDEPGRQQFLDLLPVDPSLFFIESAQTLLHRLRASSNLKGVLGDIPRYAGHVRGTPCEHILVCAEKVDEHHFLFGIERGTDP